MCRLLTRVRVWQPFDAGSPWREWLWQRRLPHRMDPRRTVSLEKVKMEGGRKGGKDSVVFFSEVSFGSVIWIQAASNPSFLSTNYQRIDILSLSLLFFFLRPLTQCEGRVAALALSLTEEWLLLTAGRIIEKKANKFWWKKESIEAFGSKCIQRLWCSKYFYKYIMCSLQVSHVGWKHYFTISNVHWKHVDLLML